MKIGLQEFSEGIEKMVVKRLEGGVENIVDEIIKQMIGNSTRNIVEDQSTDQNEKNSKNLLSPFKPNSGKTLSLQLGTLIRKSVTYFSQLRSSSVSLDRN